MAPEWIIAGCVLGVLALARFALAFKSSRKDGTLARVHPYRKMMPMIMPTKMESLVFFDQWLPTAELKSYLAEHGKPIGCNMTHIMVAAIARGLHAHPNINRFIAGQRIYQRDGVWMSFSMKRKKLDAKAKIATVKIPVPVGMTLEQMCASVNDKIGAERKDDDTYLDKELSLFFKLPHFILKRAPAWLHWLNDHHILPYSFTRDDAMFTSIFVANLGSLGMGAGYHHLYEWGNCPLFLMVGKTEERVLSDGEGGFRTEEGVWLKFTFDERVDDGLSARRGMETMFEALEHPLEAFGAGGTTPMS